MSVTSDFETRPEPSSEVTRGPSTRESLGLVVVWDPGEPGYVGAWIPVGQRGKFLVGRGRSPMKTGVAAEVPRASILRQRPSGNEPLPPMGNPSLSRAQLLVEELSGALQVTNIGRLTLRVNGAETPAATLTPGDLLELGSSLILMCACRRTSLAPARDDFEFGAADTFGIVGESAAAWELRATIENSAQHPGHVLILGQSGVGKELVARALHAASNAAGALVARNAATIPESLVDAELFGNAKGYPNPGLPERPGLVGSANEGTLFLDEFADLPQAAQAHLLRVLDSGEYHRLGEAKARRSRFKLVAATSRSEEQLRKDLSARFDFKIKVAPLASRREDIPLLARHLLRDMTADKPALRERAFNGGQANFSADLVSRLLQHPFETNTRELRQLLWRSLLAAEGGPLEWPDALPQTSDEEVAAPLSTSSESAHPALTPEVIQAALDHNNGSLESTYRSLGLSSRHVLARLVRKHGLRVTRRSAR